MIMGFENCYVTRDTLGTGKRTQRIKGKHLKIIYMIYQYPKSIKILYNLITLSNINKRQRL